MEKLVWDSERTLDLMTIAEALENHTAKNSNYDTSRSYISMSHAALPANEIIEQFKSGFQDSLEIRLKCYKGYQMEKDLVRRIKDVYGSKIEVGVEYTGFEGIVKGHPDFTFEDYPADCKSVLMDDWLPKDKLPRKVFFQMQAYMKYSGKQKALVIYESRESGRILSFWLTPISSIQRDIDAKFELVLSVLDL